jgi:hypothetical protein
MRMCVDFEHSQDPRIFENSSPGDDQLRWTTTTKITVGQSLFSFPEAAPVP